MWDVPHFAKASRDYHFKIKNIRLDVFYLRNARWCAHRVAPTFVGAKWWRWGDSNPRAGEECLSVYARSLLFYLSITTLKRAKCYYADFLIFKIRSEKFWSLFRKYIALHQLSEVLVQNASLRESGDWNERKVLHTKVWRNFCSHLSGQFCN